jgi:hypothetical protein
MTRTKKGEKKKLHKLKSSVLIIATVFMLASLLSTCAARAPQTTVNFTIMASGSCMVFDDVFDQSQIFNLGTGSINFNGKSDVESGVLPASEPSYEFYFATNHFRPMQRTVNVNWEGHSVSLSFIPKDTTGAIFIHNANFQEMNGVSRDYMLVGFLPNFGESDASMLQYRGTYTDEGGVHLLSGKAVIYAEPVDGGDAILLVLYSHDGAGILDIIWFSVETVVDIPGGSITVPAANPFITSFTVNTP